MKKIIYILLLIATGTPAFAFGPFATPKNTHTNTLIKKSIEARLKKTERRPVPKIAINNPQAIYDY